MMELGIDDIRRAIAQERFSVLYQPQLCVRTQKVGGIEALIRMRKKLDTLIPPDAFIPVLEREDMIGELTNMVIRLVVRDYKVLRALGYGVPVGVNISTRDLRHGDFIPHFLHALDANGCDASAFTFEITESSVVDDYKESASNVALLRSVGARISIDDFGTGYASCKYIRHFPMQEVKIDREFISAMADSQIDQTIVAFIIDLAHKLGFSVVAEGVETSQTANMLTGIGCDRIQGFWYARPLSLFDLVDFLRLHGVTNVEPD